MRVNRDGSFNFEEKRTFIFNGSFSWADLTVNKEGAEEIRNFQIMEENKKYKIGRDVPATYYFEEYSDKIFAKWFYSAEDEERTFIISYKVLGAIKAYDDIAELHREFIGIDWLKSLDYAEVNIHLPKGAKKSELKAWIHGNNKGKVEIVNSREIKVSVEPLQVGEFLEGRIVFPASLVPQALKIEGKRLPTILKIEARWRRHTTFKRMIEWLKIVLPFLIMFLIIIVLLFIYLIFKRKLQQS